MRGVAIYLLRILLALAPAVAVPARAAAQHLLDKHVTPAGGLQPLAEALKDIARQGGFHFSYNSLLVPGDSLVRVPAFETTVQALITGLLGPGYRYAEKGRYLIIRRADAAAADKLLRGRVISGLTGTGIAEASIYEKTELVTTLSDAEGYFLLKMKKPLPIAELGISRLGFKDTTLLVSPEAGGQLTVRLFPVRSVMLDSVVVTPHIENSWLGRLVISSRQRTRNLNLSGFFVRQPFQYSLVPGIGTHGRMNPQVVNKFSFNILGGYSGGVNGFELGGLFNIDKKDVQYAQVGGLFNTVGGGVRGVQIGGLVNTVIGPVSGIQVAGLVNKAGGPARGLRIAGIINRQPSFRGMAVAGIANRTDSAAAGLQLAGILNKARRTDGWQLGLLNIADSSGGFSIGLVNIIRYGYHRASVYATDALDINVAFKGGNKRLYSILVAGTSVGKGRKAYGLGYGLGKAIPLAPRLALTPEITAQSIYTGRWKSLSMLARLQPSVEWSPRPHLSCFLGPSFSVYFRQGSPGPGYGGIVPSHAMQPAAHVSAWLGFQAGFSFF